MPPFIGEGTYGCVFKPPVSCRNRGNIGSNSVVGKVFRSDKEFKKEVEINDIVKLIDPQRKFTLPMLNTCRTSNFESKDQVGQCRLINNPYDSSGFSQILYKDGGQNFKQVMNTIKGSPRIFIKVMKMFKPVLQGLVQMQAYGYVHQDIKPQNMLLKNKKIYLIDFGLINSANNIYSEEQRYILQYDYPYYPPEYKLWVYNNSFTNFHNKVLRNYQFTIIINGKSYNLMDTMKKMGIDIKKELKELFALQKKAMQVGKIDVFSLGVVILELYIWSGLYDEKFDKSSKAYAINEELRKFITSMIHLNVAKRANSTTVFARYKALMKHFN